MNVSTRFAQLSISLIQADYIRTYFLSRFFSSLSQVSQGFDVGCCSIVGSFNFFSKFFLEERREEEEERREEEEERERVSYTE